MSLRCLFVDRDGTINVEKAHLYRIEDFEYIPRALDALRLVTEHNVKTYIVTNQAGIAKGLYGEDDFKALTVKMLDDMRAHGIEIAEVLYCPHHPQATVAAYRMACACRKPNAGLLQQVVDKEGYCPDSMALVGDKNSDIEAGRQLGIATYLVETGYGTAEKQSTRADYVVSDLMAAVEQILRRGPVERAGVDT
jgi:D-glycero-D-manno-heptose 1,7-bisphosphate phosphatase